MSYRELFLTPTPLITYIAKGVPVTAKAIGVPFDATSTYRPGSRFGPNAIREAFLNIEVYSRRLDVDLEAQSVEDLGNLSHTASVDGMTSAVERVVGEVVREGVVAAVLGGEHAITYGAFSSMPEDTGLVVFDAHLDLREEFAGIKLSHATFLRRLAEKMDVKRIVHVGARAATRSEWAFLEENGIKNITTEEIFESSGPESLLAELLEGFSRIYVSIDLDVMDPACAPAVGNPEPGGPSTRQILELLYVLKGKRIAGFDITELAPPYDDGATSAVAAKFLAELLCLAVKQGGAVS